MKNNPCHCFALPHRPPASNPLSRGISVALAAFIIVGSAAGQITIPPPLTVTVNSSDDTHDANLSDGRCADSNGQCTLRAAIEQTNNYFGRGPDTIQFNIPTIDPGFDPTTGITTIYAYGLPDLIGSVNITGPGANKLIIDGVGFPYDARIFNVTTAGTVYISGVTMQNAETVSGQYGAAIQNVNAGTVTLTNCTLLNNQSPDGGGAIYNAGAGTINISNSLLLRNRVSASGAFNELGGAIWNKTGTIHITNTTFQQNQATNGGGAIFNDSGTVTVVGSTFYGNSSSFVGGGIRSYGGTVSVTNSTFFANTSEFFGGAIHNANNGVLNVTNSTLTANTSTYGGSGIFNDSVGAAVANVKSTLIAGNLLGEYLGVAAPDVYGPFSSKGFNLIGKKDGSTGFTTATDKTGTAKAPLNPKLDWRGLWNNGGPTQTVALLSGSPAVDKGTSVGLTGTLTTDQRGLARKVQKTVADANGGDGTDIGAFEVQ